MVTKGHSFVCWLRILVITMLALSIGAFQLKAQNTADVLGTVTDTSGAAVPNAKVTITNTGTSVARSMQTGAAGDYAFTLLPVGTYSVAVEANGFKMFQAPNVSISAGDRARVDAKMEVGTLSQTVT